VEIGAYLSTDFSETVAKLRHWAKSAHHERDGLT
jgi:hypothetical protein